ncbi:MAG: hypothetical protein IJ087_00210 [Eggerthellaceae bacterium]|nr:hypothetical protein [Eggerthellaceae bacterium]
MTPRTISKTLDDVAAWVASEIAPKLEYLVPPDDGSVGGFEVETAHPVVYQSFVPGKERLTQGQLQAPSIAVQLLGGSDASSGNRTLNVRLVLTIWAPGHYDADGFHRDQDGWRDLHNGLDAMAVAVGSAEVIAGCAVNLSRGVQFGYFDIEGEIPDLYPYWMGKVDFELTGAYPANKRFENLL